MKNVCRVLVCLLFSVAVLAQPASAPPLEVLTEKDITFATECGAPGVGRKWGGPTAGQIERKEGRPGYRVNEGGYWEVNCKAPSPPSPPSPCPGSGLPAEWSVGEYICTTVRPFTAPSPSALHQAIESGKVQIFRQWIGPMRGVLIEKCTDGVRSTVSATCSPATHCDTSWSKRTGVPAVTYTYDARPQSARIALGSYAEAKGSDGSSLRVQCVAGEIKPAPQCLPGQKITQTYSGGPIDPKTGERLGDIRVYRYDGEPVDPGKKVKLLQIEGRPMPDGTPRFLIGRCSASGRLQ